MKLNNVKAVSGYIDTTTNKPHVLTDNMVPTEVFLTTDNKVFSNLEDANIHQLRTDTKDELMKVIGSIANRSGWEIYEKLTGKPDLSARMIAALQVLNNIKPFIS